MRTLRADQIETWNSQVRQGHAQAVARELQAVTRDQIPDELLSAFANLAWRVNAPKLGLRLLHPYLLRAHQLKRLPNPAIQTEFAGCLLEVGAVAESRALLRSVSGQEPRAAFYEALACFKEWDYDAAVPLLETYLASLPDDYHRLVIQVNLASAYVMTRDWLAAEKLLVPLRERLERDRHFLLLGNVCEISSQIPFAQGDFDGALAWLERGDVHLNPARNMGWLYGRKWHLINRLMRDRSRGSRSFKDEFSDLRAKAAEMRSWETVRDLDLHWALTFADTALLTRVAFGSPVPRYRERVRTLAAREGLRIEETREFLFRGDDDTPGLKPRPLSQLVNGPTLSKLPSRLFLTLLSDFYAPFRTGHLFSMLFPQDHYNPETSPDKVFQVVARLRKELAGHLDAEILSDKSGYRLRLAPGQDLLFPSSWLNLGEDQNEDLPSSLILERFGDRNFSAGELARVLGVSARTCNRLLRRLADEGRVAQSGTGRSTKFRKAG